MGSNYYKIIQERTFYEDGKADCHGTFLVMFKNEAEYTLQYLVNKH